MSEPDVIEQPAAPTPVACSAWLGRAVVWMESAPHRLWCNVSPGNIYASDGDPCDCGRDEIVAALDAMRRPNKHITNSEHTK